MDYKYRCGKKIITVWRPTIVPTEIVRVYTGGRQYPRTIHTDHKGSFFTWDKQKVYLDNWIRLPMKELKEQIERKKSVTAYDLCTAILSDGVDKARFIVPMNTIAFPGIFANGCDFKNVECRVVEEFNREVANCYKLVCVPVTPDVTVVPKREFYVLDMLSLLEDGIIKIVI